MLEDAQVQTHRKARLRELINNAYGELIVNLAREIDRSESYIGRMLYPPEKDYSRPVSDKLAMVIEKAAGLRRGWFDLPLGTELPNPVPGRSIALAAASPQMPAHASDSAGTARQQAAIVWPFRLVSYSRLRRVREQLGQRRGHDALADIDSVLDAVVSKWEKEAARARSA